MKLLIASLFAFSSAAFAANIVPRQLSRRNPCVVLYAGFRKQLRC